MKTKKPEKIRVTIDLSIQAYQLLEELQALVDEDTKAKVIRDALKVYKYIMEEQKNKSQFIVKKDGGKEFIVRWVN